jgi:large subunit ribosomal protein L23
MKTPHKTLLRDYDVIRYPLLTEKSNTLTDQSQYFFAVSLDANKSEIKRAIENLFKVKVASVNTLIRKGKNKVFRGRRGLQSDMKKAMVRLKAGQKLDITTGV